MRDSAHSLRTALSSVAGFAGIGALGFGIKSIVQQGIDWQNQQAQLQNALHDTGQAGKVSLKQINAGLESMKGGFDPAETTAGVTRLIRVTNDARAAIQANADATELARGAPIAYATALQLVAQAASGSAGRLSRYVGAIQPVTTHLSALSRVTKKLHPELVAQAKALDKQATAAEIHARIQARYGGAAEKFSKTIAGQLSEHRTHLALLEKEIGVKLLPVIVKLLGMLDNFVTYLGAHKDVAMALVGALGFLAGAWLAVAAAELVAALFDPFTLAIIAVTVLVADIILLEKRFHLFTNAWRDGTKWISQAWQDTSNWVTNAIHNIGGAFDWLVTKIKALFSGLANILIAPINLAIEAINVLISAYNEVQKYIPFGLGAGQIKLVGGIPSVHMAMGGLVPGVGSGDTRHASLTPGEFVLRKQVVSAVGAQNLHALNQGAVPSVTGSPDYIVVKAYTNVDGRTIAESVTHHALKMQARK